MQQALDGSTLRWWLPGIGDGGEALAPGAPVVVTVSVSPVRPGHAVSIEYRVDGGPVREQPAVPAAPGPQAGAREYSALLPAPGGGGELQCLPLLRQAGQLLSPRLGDAQAVPSRHAIAAVPAAASPSAAAPGVPSPTPSLASAPRVPRFGWELKFLGALTAFVRPERVGPTPDGLRIDWHVTEGRFLGPGLDARVLPGATDWMRIRPDGMGIVDVQACFETSEGALIYGSYGGMFDLGEDGYARALRDDYDPLPPVVVTPTYATADKGLYWLNRVQCVGIGRVDMRARRVQFDVYQVVVGGLLPSARG